MTAPLDLLPVPLRGFHLIEASAGTGTTRTITDIFVRLLAEGRKVGEILVVTFTEAATKELRTRLRKRVAEALAVSDGQRGDPVLERLVAGDGEKRHRLRQRLKSAVTGFDEAAIFTIHGFCRKILQEHCFASGQLFDMELVADTSFLLQEGVEDFWRRLLPQTSPLFLRFLLKQLQDRRRGRDAPEVLADFAGQVMARPDLRILFPPSAEDQEEKEKELLSRYQRMAGLWAGDRDGIGTLLLDEGLNRRSYPPDKVPSWSSQGDDFFLSGDPLCEWKHLDRFSADTLAKACKKGFSPVHHPFFEECRLFLQERDRLKEDYAGSLGQLKKELILFLKQELPLRKEKLQIRSFDDLLLHLRRALNAGGGALAAAVRGKFPVALIDEFQDTDPVQYEIFRAVYDHPESLLFIIGDPKQAIYSFRGADIFTYMAAGREAARIPLAVNWRSAPQLVRGVNSLFGNAANPFVFDAIRFHGVVAADKEEREILQLPPGGPAAPLRLWYFPRQDDEEEGIPRERADEVIPRAVAAEIRQLLEMGRRGAARLLTLIKTDDAGETVGGDRPLEAGDIAVIVRTNRETRLLRDALARHGIPSVIHGSESLFAAAEAEDVLRLLQAVAEPGNEGLVRAALATPLFGFTPKTFHELLEDEPGWGKWLEKFIEWHRLWLDFGLITMATALMNREGIRERLIRLPQGERRLTNLIHCWELLHRTAEERHLGMKGAVKWFARQVADRPDQEEYQLRLETDDKAVQVITIHRSKGLEFPVVFVPYCWSSPRGGLVFFHDAKAENQLTLDLGSADFGAHKDAMAAEELAENMRLLYVALTRAKHLCYLAWGAFRGGERSAVAYLFHSRGAPSGNGFSLAFDNFSDDDLTADLGTIAADPESGISLAAPPVSERATDGPLLPLTETRPLVLPPTPEKIPQPWRMNSFSSLTSARPIAESAPELESVDDLASTADQDLQAATPLSMMDFPRGVRPGLCLHHVLENVDFQARGKDEWRPAIAEGLRRFGFDEKIWLEPVAEMVGQLVANPLGQGEEVFYLRDLGRSERLAEMGFYFPVNGLSNGALARALAGRSSLGPDFAQRLARLPDSTRNGFMKGFIDLVCRHGGRYYIIDWKSNHLGGRLEDYHAGKLAAVMEREFYLLQYHLYVLALHKYLRSRIGDYRYADHFGGVFYIFLRGLGGGGSCGIFRDRPAPAAIEELERCFAGGHEEESP